MKTENPHPDELVHSREGFITDPAFIWVSSTEEVRGQKEGNAAPFNNLNYP